jgi:phosphatidylinositol-3-phosphatase
VRLPGAFRTRKRIPLLGIWAAFFLCALGSAPLNAATADLPRPAHVVVVIEENHTSAEIIGNSAAPFMNALAREGALFTRSYAITHPSLPNYFALFAGLTNDNGDDCPATGLSPRAPNLATALAAAHLSFKGYAEGLPAPGSMVCWAGRYARKHAPWIAFSNIAQTSESLPFTDFPANYDALPSVAFVIPDQMDDMHDGTIGQADTWLARHLAPLVNWAQHHDALVILTWDEDDLSADNHIPTIFAGAMVKPGRYGERITHYSVLRTIEDFYGLPHLGRSGGAKPITDCWR